MADATTSLMVSGNGDVIAPEDGVPPPFLFLSPPLLFLFLSLFFLFFFFLYFPFKVMAVGSGGTYALSAARALIDVEVPSFFSCFIVFPFIFPQIFTEIPLFYIVVLRFYHFF